MQELLLIATPLALAAIGYVFKRWLEHRGRSEALKRKLQTLSLHHGMKRAGLSLNELEQLERDASQ